MQRVTPVFGWRLARPREARSPPAATRRAPRPSGRSVRLPNNLPSLDEVPWVTTSTPFP